MIRDYSGASSPHLVNGAEMTLTRADARRVSEARKTLYAIHGLALWRGPEGSSSSSERISPVSATIRPAAAALFCAALGRARPLPSGQTVRRRRSDGLE